MIIEGKGPLAKETMESLKRRVSGLAKNNPKIPYLGKEEYRLLLFPNAKHLAVVTYEDTD